MRNPKSATVLDWNLVGRNVKLGREMHGMTRCELAKEARVSRTTLRQAENGHPVRKSCLKRIARGLSIGFDTIVRANQPGQIKDSSRTFAIHLPEQTVWYEFEDKRPVISEDNFIRIQSLKERARLGKLGFVPAFISSPSFLMSEGPGLNFIELYGPWTDTLNSHTYRDCLLCCVSGEVLFSMGSEIVLLAPGAVVGFETRLEFRLEPAKPIGVDETPPSLIWVGANRVGRVSPAGKRFSAKGRNRT